MAMRVDSLLRHSICAALLLAPFGATACGAAGPEDGAQTNRKTEAEARSRTDALGIEPGAQPAPEVVVIGVAADSLVTDGTNIYWRANTFDATSGSSTVIVGKCPVGGGCIVGGTVLAVTSAQLLFGGSDQVALTSGKVIVPVAGTLFACDTGGCGGQLSTVIKTSDFITSVTARGNEVFFGLSGFESGSRTVVACDINHCATPRVLGTTDDLGSAPHYPSFSDRSSTVAFKQNGIYITPARGFPAAGPTLLTSADGVEGGVWNDGTDVYFSVGGQLATDDQGNSWIANDTGYVGRCAVTGCGGNATLLASGESNVGGIVVAGDDVYWPVGGPVDNVSGLPTGPGSIQTCSKTDGCAVVTTLAAGGNPSQLTVDSSYVYWGDPFAMKISRIRRH
jgi:hypothetical protein